MKKTIKWLLALIIIAIFSVGIIEFCKSEEIKRSFFQSYSVPEKVCEYEYDGTKYYLYLGDIDTTINFDATKDYIYEFISFNGLIYGEQRDLYILKSEFNSDTRTPIEMAISKHINKLEDENKRLFKRSEMINDLKY